MNQASQGKRHGSNWPTPLQELLLRAVLGSGEEVLRSWQEWKAQIDIEDLELGSSRLLPLLRRNLENLGVNDPLLTRYKSVARHSWTRNQLIFAQAKKMLSELSGAGIPTLVLKGGALIPLYYRDFSTRAMSDFDILVPTRRAPQAFEFLLSQGYLTPRGARPTSLEVKSLSVFNGSTFRRPGGERFDVHQHVFSQSFAPDTDDEFWSAAIPLKIGEIETLSLCAEDAFLHVCVHGVPWNEVPALRWVVDAAFILRATPELDWDRLVAQANRLRLQIPLRQTLRYLLRLNLDIPVSKKAIRSLEQAPTSRAERREWAALSSPLLEHSPALALWLRSRRYSRWSATHSIWKRPFIFPLYMQYFWGLDSLSEFPNYALKRLKERTPQYSEGE